ncbi:Aerobic cobaltochelatase subunit CobN [Mycobacterium talmoniae]|uniref:Aerobic cobaltochelatase subunit CobN n=1 Tax=Mycobacterium talmoniae TaxID=1858794 RepID=A0A2S8BNS0_9MYCO|nr:Aerobic cobaltochelatase subunit CobN [Mycobacterium talmoniae]
MLRFAATEVVPRLAGTAGEIEQVLRALDGRFIPAGPSGSPLRGLVNVLPTGRNFYSVDPKAVPSRLAWETGVAMADSLLARYRDDYGRWPASVGLSVWGTSRCAPPATTSPKCLRCSVFGRCGMTRRGGWWA